MEDRSTQLTALRMSNIESKKLTRECIQTALLYLLEEQPFEKITATDIIKRSGVSRAGFYRNYNSKEAVLEDVTDIIFNKMLVFFTNDKYKNNSYQRCLDIFKELVDHKDTVKLLLHANVPREFILLKTDAFFKQLITYETPEDYYQIIAVTTSLKEVALAWIEHGMKETPEEMADFFANLFQFPKNL